MKVDDEVVELEQWDAIRFGKDTMREHGGRARGVRVPRVRRRRRPEGSRDGTRLVERVGSAPQTQGGRMHATIRNYSGGPRSPTRSPSTRTTIRELLTGIDGFRAYYVVRDGDGATTISVFDDQAGAEESTRAAAQWVGREPRRPRRRAAAGDERRGRSSASRRTPPPQCRTSSAWRLSGSRSGTRGRAERCRPPALRVRRAIRCVHRLDDEEEDRGCDRDERNQGVDEVAVAEPAAVDREGRARRSRACRRSRRSAA